MLLFSYRHSLNNTHARFFDRALSFQSVCVTLLTSLEVRNKKKETQTYQKEESSQEARIIFKYYFEGYFV